MRYGEGQYGEGRYGLELSDDATEEGQERVDQTCDELQEMRAEAQEVREQARRWRYTSAVLTIASIALSILPLTRGDRMSALLRSTMLSRSGSTVLASIEQIGPVHFEIDRASPVGGAVVSERRVVEWTFLIVSDSVSTSSGLHRLK